MLRRFATLSLSIACLALLVACRDKPAPVAPSATVSAVAISGIPANLEVGATAALKATATYTDSSTRDCTTTAVWSSSDTTVANVSGSGLLAAVAPGEAEIRAKCAAITGHSGIRVSAPPPRARLTVSIPDGQLRALWRITPILFDAGPSTGDGLTSLIEFGDGDVSTSAAVAHVPSLGWKVEHGTARLTVTDRWGRTDTATAIYQVWSFSWESLGMWIGAPGPIILYPRQDTGNPGMLSGWTPTWGGRDLVGTVAADRSMRLTTTDGAIELTGRFSFDDSHDGGRGFLRLSIRGGPDDGRTLDFYFHDPY